MSERSSTPSFADMQRQWQELAEAAAKPWQEAAKAFAEPWRELAESFGQRTDFQSVGQEAWDKLASSFSALVEQQQQIAQAIFDAMRAGAEEMQKAMEQTVEQITAFARSATGGGGSSESSPTGSAESSETPKKSTRATKARKAAKS